MYWVVKGRKIFPLSKNYERRWVIRRSRVGESLKRFFDGLIFQKEGDHETIKKNHI